MGDWEISEWAQGYKNHTVTIPSYESPDGSCTRCSHLSAELSLKPNDLEDINETLSALLNIDARKRPSARELKIKWEMWEGQES